MQYRLKGIKIKIKTEVLILVCSLRIFSWLLIIWVQIGKGVLQGCILSLCLFNLYTEYIMQNARLDEAQTRIKIARRNINNLRDAGDNILWQKAKRN